MNDAPPPFQPTSLAEHRLADALRAGRPMLWRNPLQRPANTVLDLLQRTDNIGLSDVEAADHLLRRWAAALAARFPELASSKGVIESPLIELPELASTTGVKGLSRGLIKADHALPVAGSIKARGGIYEVLTIAEKVAQAHGFDAEREAPLRLLEHDARALFAQHTIAVGSTGNLGLSIGIMASALGFHAVVHMSHDAKGWKKARLRACGVDVVEHHGDYATAVAAGRVAASASATTYFIDDENSRNLFLGYAVAALRLKEQLAEQKVIVSEERPLIAYLPCGVGGAPGGITFGLKSVFGDAAHCYFAEPCASPAMLVRMAFADRPRSVYEFGLDNLTEADGLAVAQASELVYQLVRELVSGVYTVADDALFMTLARLHQKHGIAIEPSAAAAFLGPLRFRDKDIFGAPGATGDLARATHVFWTTGGSLVPPDEFEKFHRHGCALLGPESV